jgi:hypothetical protein
MQKICSITFSVQEDNSAGRVQRWRISMAGYDECGACQFPPPLDDLELIAALEDDASEAVLAHLQECPSCAGRAREYRIIQDILRKQLFRKLCPSSDHLLAFYQRVLNPDRYVAIADHLIDCPYCARELRLLDRVARLPIPNLPARRVVLNLEAPRLRPLAEAIYGRSARSTPSYYVYRYEDTQLTLSVERTHHSVHPTINGLLVIGNAVAAQPGATASLLNENGIIASAPLDELGCFWLHNIPIGCHDLSLRLSDREIVVEHLNL